MSKETEREEIKDETHELQDDEQSDVEEEKCTIKAILMF
jgi:hypothetical protein